MIGFYNISILKVPEISTSLDVVKINFYNSHKVRNIFTKSFSRLKLFQDREHSNNIFECDLRIKEKYYGLCDISNDTKWECMEV